MPLLVLVVLTGCLWQSTAAKPSPPVAAAQTTSPAIIRRVEAVYPASAISARVQGKVIVRVTFAASGDVTGAEILDSVPMLDQAALDAVKQWRFERSEGGGRIDVAIAFRLTDDSSFLKRHPWEIGIVQPVAGSAPAVAPAPDMVDGQKVQPLPRALLPERIYQVTPAQPSKGKPAGVRIVVIADLTVSSSGMVVHARPVECMAYTEDGPGVPGKPSVAVPDFPGIEGYLEETLKAMMQWRFAPPQADRVAVPTVTTATYLW